ncbi:hypothetical protein JW948_01550 [bacterium]|nr:hypothetical protein [bacterium]
MIDSYTFGRMVIGGTKYHKDLIILPDGAVLCPWRRKAGHALSLTDLEEITAASPDILVAGTGMPGLMKPEKNLTEELETRGIEIRIMPTLKAVREYNALYGQGWRAAACFHLTC